MRAEKLKVLKMLAAGKLTAAEADMLLEALGETPLRPSEKLSLPESLVREPGKD